MPQVSPHAIVKLTDNQNHLLGHTEAVEYFPRECSIDGVVCLGEIDNAPIQLYSFLSCQVHQHHVGSGTVRPETSFFLGQDPLMLVVGTETASDDLRQYLADVRYQRDTPVVAALCPILHLVERLHGGIFPFWRDLSPLQMLTTMLSSLVAGRNPH